MFTATTILAVKKDGHTAMAGDGQVTMGNAVIMKNTARKVRRLYHGKIIAGFAGSVADAFSLFDKFEAKLRDCNGNLVRAAVEFAKDWRSDRVLQKLEALLILTDGEHLFLVSGSGEVIGYWKRRQLCPLGSPCTVTEHRSFCPRNSGKITSYCSRYLCIHQS